MRPFIVKKFSCRDLRLISCLVSPEKLFSFSRYLNFCLGFWARIKNDWIRKKRLRYNDTFKVSRCSTKLINVCIKLPLALDCGQSKYSQQISNIHIFQFWVWLFRFLSYVISKTSSFLS